MVYLSGSFNSWSLRSNEHYFSKENNGSDSLTILLPPGNYEYKFTRGDWTKVETLASGKDIVNRKIHIEHDTSINIKITAWRDDFPQEQIIRKHTASVHVSILDSAFYMPQLNRTRKIWMYLPFDYSTTTKRYPVIYMHDGQNVFDEFTSGFGEWGVDEFLDTFKKNMKTCIIVAIEHGADKRMKEYNPYEFRKYGKGEGDKYVRFIAETLKPYIDKNFRTIKNRNNTLIAGSSMGGLISLYAVIRYPNVFGGAGFFSPAFWTAPGLDNDIKKLSASFNPKLFFYAGGKESDEMIPDMKHIEQLIKAYAPNAIIKEITDQHASHNEIAWKHYFPAFYNWIVP